MTERKGARYSVHPGAKRPAQSHAEHTQRTQATTWAESVEGAHIKQSDGSFKAVSDAEYSDWRTARKLRGEG